MYQDNAEKKPKVGRPRKYSFSSLASVDKAEYNRLYYQQNKETMKEKIIEARHNRLANERGQQEFLPLKRGRKKENKEKQEMNQEIEKITKQIDELIIKRDKLIEKNQDITDFNNGERIFVKK